MPGQTAPAPYHPLLVAPHTWAEPYCIVAEEGQPLRFSIQDALNYHGYDAPGGLVLGFRLLQRAIGLLVPAGDIPERDKFTLFTAFPGLGFRDCMELVTRMVSGNRITVDINFADTTAQAGVIGRFYYRFAKVIRVL